jgi:hypothetical protein
LREALGKIKIVGEFPKSAVPLQVFAIVFLDVSAFRGLPHFAAGGTEFFNAFRGLGVRDQFHGKHFQLRPHLQNLHDFLVSEGGDDTPLVRSANYQTLVFQRDKRLPHGRMADSEA